MGHLCTHYMEDLFPNLEASHGLDGVGGGGGVGVGPGVGVHTIAEGIVLVTGATYIYIST